MSHQEKNDCSQKNLAFAALANHWMHEKRMFFKESTAIKYQNLMKLYLIPEFGNCAPEDLTTAKINKFSTKLLKNGGQKEKGLSPKSVSDILTLLRNIIRSAKSQGFQIPATDITMPIKQSKKQIRIFSITEQKKLYSYLKKDNNYTDFGILLCSLTGLRIGEICALKWKDISLDDQTIFVHQTMQRLQIEQPTAQKTKVVISSPKSLCSIRQIPIPNEMLELLKKKRSSPEAFLLTGSDSKYIEPRTLQYQFKKALQECGIKDANFHMLRHTFATRCIEVGFDLKSLSEILGHANINITLNCYVHPSMDIKRKNMSKLSVLFETP